MLGSVESLQIVPETHEVPPSGTPPQPVELSSRPASPFIPPSAPSDAPMPPSQRGIYPQVYTPYGGHYGRPNRHMYPTQTRNENDPYVAVDPFKPSIMQKHRKNTARPDNMTYGADPTHMAYADYGPSSYPHYSSYPYPSNGYPAYGVSSQPPRAPYQPIVVPARAWASAPPRRPSVVSEKLSSRGRSRSPRRQHRTRSRSRRRSRSMSRGRSRRKESSQAPPSKADSKSRPSESPRRSHVSSANHDDIVVQQIIRTPSVLSHADEVEEDESVVTSRRDNVKSAPSNGQVKTRRNPSWVTWRPDSAIQPIPYVPAPAPEVKEYSIHGESEMLTHDQVATRTLVITVLFDLIPRQVYLHFLLRLPYLYFSRVTRIFEETELSMAEIRKQTLENKGNPFGYFPGDKIGLVKTWESFIESLLREWKTLNIVSVLLLSAILTILQIDVAASDPIIRYSALLSMICALMSLLYGCMYIIRFGSMKKAHKAAEWAEEAQSTTTNIFWNVWVLLAIPATWLAWSIILYVTCIAAFIWRTSPGEDPGSLPISNPLWPRIVLSAILGLGLVYFVLIIATLRRYGDAMDQAWRIRVENWAQSWPYPGPQNDNPYYHNPYDQSGKRDFGTTSMAPMPPVKIPSSSEWRNDWRNNPYDWGNARNNDSDPWELAQSERDRQNNSRRSSIIPSERPKSRSFRRPSPSTLPPVVIQIPRSSGETEHPPPDLKKSGPSDAGNTGPNSDGPSASILLPSPAKAQALSTEELNSPDPDCGTGDIYEITSPGETAADTLWKYSLPFDKSRAIKVYDINSGLEESLVDEERCNKFRGGIPTKEIFDRVAKDLRHCTAYSNSNAKEGVDQTHLKEVFDVLQRFNDVVFYRLGSRIALCEELSGGRPSVYFMIHPRLPVNAM